MKIVQIAFFVVAAFSSVTTASDLPNLGGSFQGNFTPRQERRLGESIMVSIRQDRSMVDDVELTTYLNSLGYRLVASSTENRQDFEFFVIEDDALNAFALPGGFIGVHTGLIVNAQSESELASVLAHEIAHVVQRHLARMLDQQERSSMLSMLGLAAAILAARSNPDVAQAAIGVASGLPVQKQLDFSRDHEREADRVGMQILQQAGFDPRAMPSFLERLQRFYRVYDDKRAPDYLRTHPITADRIADVQGRADKTSYRQSADSLEFQLLRAKLRARQGSAGEAVVHFDSLLKEKKYVVDTAPRYGLVHALLRDRKPQRAADELKLLRAKASHPMLETLAAETRIALNDWDGALLVYRTALAKYPQHTALIHGYAAALLQRDQVAAAMNIITDRLSLTPGDYRLYALRARGYAAQGKRLLQHQAQAETYYLQGRLGEAIEQLQLAQQGKDGDFYQISAVDARLRDLRQQEADAKAEAKKN